MNKWQPIETAPKDMSVILCYSDEGVYQGKYWANSDLWYPLILDCHGCGCCGGDIPKPTHWMPLPEMPEEKA